MSKSQAQRAAEGLPEAIEERVEAVRERLAEADVQIRETIEAHPVAVVAGAFVGGYLLGRLVTKL